MAANMGLKPGVQWTGTGALFTIFSRHAERVWLMLFDSPGAEKPDRDIELDPAVHRRGDFWAIEVEGVRPGQAYLFRMDGTRGSFDPAQWLLDPYARAIHTGRGWGETAGLEAGTWPKSGPGFPKGVLLAAEAYDWGTDRSPSVSMAETVIYEAHLRGFTVHPHSGVVRPGTYRGFIEKIPHLRELGVTAVEFLPLQEFNEMEFFLQNGSRRALRDFWGYSPMAYFAPMSRYASDPAGAGPLNEFRDLVKALHAAGIEVFLDVVFNHTGEWDENGPVFSFKGLDQTVYYIMKADGTGYENYSGCGNTIKANHPVVQEFVLDVLRYWAVELHVDGFRFDLASVLARDRDGSILDRSPLIDRISEDPALLRVKLFAEAWDAAGLFQVGSFPHSRWSEWNGLYRDDVRRFWAGEPGRLGRLATRLAGSADLYNRDGQTPLKSVNFVTCHDGFTLADLVRYAVPHNEANGDQDKDGERNNHSANYGVEGPSDDPAIESLRLRQQKNILATLFLSRGVPMLLAGDEFGRTQRGNNNAYDQDNEISWVDWERAAENAGLTDFVRALIAFRRRCPALRRDGFYKGGMNADGLPPDILWYGPDGCDPDWDKGAAVAFRLSGNSRHTGAATDGDDLFLIFNGALSAESFHLPGPGVESWQTAWSTSDLRPCPVSSGAGFSIRVEGRSVTALIRKTGD
jgi:isoamylase